MLSTERPLLREWREADREQLAAIDADREARRFLGPPMTRAQSDALVDRAQHGFRRPPGRGWFAVQERATGTLLGTVGIEHDAHAHYPPALEVGRQLARSAWGRGIATEGARALVAFAFGELALEEIVREEIVREEIVREEIVREEILREEILREEIVREEIVAFTIPANTASPRVMRPLGVTRDPADDFEHLELADVPLRRHVLPRRS